VCQGSCAAREMHLANQMRAAQHFGNRWGKIDGPWMYLSVLERGIVRYTKECARTQKVLNAKKVFALLVAPGDLD